MAENHESSAIRNSRFQRLANRQLVSIFTGAFLLVLIDYPMRQRYQIHPMNYLLLLLVFGVLVTSCDCLQRLQGYAIDAETKKPLSGVYYSEVPLTDDLKQRILSDSLSGYRPLTDSTGTFSGFNIASGFTCRPHLVLWLEKEGYEPVRLEWNKSSLDTLVVELHRTR